MCEIFPEVDKCCLCVSLRVGMLYIAILAIMTGVMLLCTIEQQSGASFHNLKNITGMQNVTDVNQAMGYISTIVPSGLTFISVIFMFTGVLLLFANYSDQEGLVQVFVWLIFLSIMIGFIMVFGVAIECMISKKTCLLRNFDWLSGAGVLVLAVGYLFLWIYFISVANTYVISVFK